MPTGLELSEPMIVNSLGLKMDYKQGDGCLYNRGSFTMAAAINYEYFRY